MNHSDYLRIEWLEVAAKELAIQIKSYPSETGPRWEVRIGVRSPTGSF